MENTTRKVITRSPSRTVRLLQLPHLQAQPVEAESSLERDFVQIAALYPHTASIKHQPFKLVWEDKSYTPDFLVGFTDGSKLVAEVKPRSKTAGYEDTFKRAREKLEANGYGFLVVTDLEIRHQGQNENALEIRRYAKTKFCAADCDRAEALIKNHPAGIRIDEALIQANVSQQLLLNLVCLHRLALEPNLSFSANALIFPIYNSEEECHAVQFASWFNT